HPQPRPSWPVSQISFPISFVSWASPAIVAQTKGSWRGPKIPLQLPAPVLAGRNQHLVDCLDVLRIRLSECAVHHLHLIALDTGRQLVPIVRLRALGHREMVVP